MNVLIDTEKLLYLRFWEQTKSWTAGFDLNFSWEENINLASTLSDLREIKPNDGLYRLVTGDTKRFQLLAVSVERIVTILTPTPAA